MHTTETESLGSIVKTLPFGSSQATIERKVESKESMWRPAPILGKEITGHHQQPGHINIPPSNLVNQAKMNNYVLPSGFS
jgi:hypothetical protein